MDWLTSGHDPAMLRGRVGSGRKDEEFGSDNAAARELPAGSASGAIAVSCLPPACSHALFAGLRLPDPPMV
jgi:hypothetical protein